jgi:hypothetical protein
MHNSDQNLKSTQLIESILLTFDSIAAKESFIKRHKMAIGEQYANEAEGVELQTAIHYTQEALSDNSIKSIENVGAVEVERDTEGEKEIASLYTSRKGEIAGMPDNLPDLESV